MKNRLGIAVYALEYWYFGDERCKKTLLDHFHVSSLAGLGLGEHELRDHRSRCTASVSDGNTENSRSQT